MPRSSFRIARLGAALALAALLGGCVAYPYGYGYYDGYGYPYYASAYPAYVAPAAPVVTGGLFIGGGWGGGWGGWHHGWRGRYWR